MVNEMNRKKDKGEMLIFFLIAYGVGYAIGIANHFMGFIETYDFALFTMILPASGVAVANMYSKGKEDENRIIHIIVVAGLALYLVMILLRMLDWIGNDTYGILSISVCVIVSLITLITAWIKGGELNPFREGRKSMILIVLFAFARIISIFVEVWQEKPDFFMSIIGVGIGLPTFLIQCICFFGEEYGWRGFLQGKLQTIFGKRGGVLLLGVLWEVWHLPSFWITDGGMGWEIIAGRFLSTVSVAVFFGYVYMKTKNVWTCAVLHYLNNAIVAAICNTVQESIGYEIDGFTIAGGCVMLAFCLGFLFSKEYEAE